ILAAPRAGSRSTPSVWELGTELITGSAPSTQCARRDPDFMNFARKHFSGSTGRRSVWALLVAAAMLVAPGLLAQDGVAEPGADGRQPGVSRVQLQQSLEQAEALANSEAYSAGFREAKRAEAALIRERLLEGYFYVGDQLTITVTGDSGFSGTKAIGPGRVLSLQGLPDI